MEPDLQEIELRLYELYQLWCEQHETKPTIKGYILWIEENYD